MVIFDYKGFYIGTPIWQMPISCQYEKRFLRMKNLMSRKEVCEHLGISMRTLCRKIEELGIVSINETLHNNVVSKKISYEDYLRIAKSCSNKPSEQQTTSGASNLMIIGLKTELIKSQINLENTLKSLDEKNDTIRKLEEKNERLFNEFMALNTKYTDSLSKKGLFWRLFSK